MEDFVCPDQLFKAFLGDEGQRVLMIVVKACGWGPFYFSTRMIAVFFTQVGTTVWAEEVLQMTALSADGCTPEALILGRVIFRRGLLTFITVDAFDEPNQV